MTEKKNEVNPAPSGSDYIVVKAKENGVQVIGLTRGWTHGFTIRRSWTKARCSLPNSPITPQQ